LVLADAARQAIDLGSGRLPVGVVTALAGGPFFLWLLRRGAWRA
ncbi:MAG: iron chelate uptake ABC transporter family permease subunit, partial [Phycisphaerales bacterium]